MKADDSDIQTHYIDALGKRHASSPAALDAIRAAMAGRHADVAENATRARRTSSAPKPHPDRTGTSSRFDAVIVVTQGTSETTGAGDLELEDGTALTVDDRLPADLPAGYHRINRRDGTTARVIVTPEACFLPDALRTWGWAIQLYSARSRRSWGIGDLADLRRLG